MDPQVRRLLDEQSEVVARRQLVEVGLAPHDVARLVRRRELARMHDGVFVAHTGTPSWEQRAWAAVLLHERSALYGVSALRAIEGPRSGREEGVVHVAVNGQRRVHHRAGLQVHRLDHIDSRVHWQSVPPRQRYEDAVLDVAAAAATRLDTIGELSRAVQLRRTTAQRLLAQVEIRPRLTGRPWIRSVLADLAAGSCSVLEHGYRTLERRHGVTGARRQVRDRVSGRAVYRDVEYDGGLVVELDGRLHHDTARQRDRDFDRDLALRVGGRDSVRLSWGQVFDRPCSTMAQIVQLLHRRGWEGSARACSASCPVGQLPFRCL